MSNELQLQKNREMIDHFLDKDCILPLDRRLHARFEQPFGYIYCIENTSNGKKYVGSTYSTWSGVENPNPRTKLLKRATNYLYEYNYVKRLLANPESTPKIKHRFNRPIISAMITDGWENFRMYPLCETTRTTHKSAELFWINKLDTIANGYNVSRVPAGINKPGRKLMAKEKQLRSEGVLCININQKQLLFSDSMKLFGDFMNSSKDMIKNSCRKGRPYKGWFIFYIDPEKRHFILETNVRGDGLPINDRHSSKSKLFYERLCGTVDMYLNNFANEEYFPEFKKLDNIEYKE